MRFVSPDVQFQVGDSGPLTARMSLKAWAALQDHWGVDNLDQAVQRLGEMDGGKLPTLDMAAILWASLRTHHADVTLDQSVDLLDDMGIPNFLQLTARCAQASVPEGEGGGKASANPLRWPWSRGPSAGSRS